MVEANNNVDEVLEISRQRNLRKSRLKAFFSVPVEQRVIGSFHDDSFDESLLVSF